MCARYVVERPEDLGEHLAHVLGVKLPSIAARHNVAPTQLVPVLPNVAPLRMQNFRWGLVPRWAKDLKIGQRTINARAETLAEKPSFRDALRRRRCLVLADGFFEWVDEGGRKQPLLMRLKERKPFAFAGLWDEWRSPDGEIVPTFTIVTTAANELLKPIHDRMPAILAPESYARWITLDEMTPEQAAPLLAPFPASAMEFVRVSPIVNRPTVDTPECTRPIG
jgi:putative SOS response-associated peptidase YedK